MCFVHTERWHHQLRYRLTVVLCGLISAVGAVAADIQVFTDLHHLIEAPADVHVVELDTPERIESGLGANLPADPARAAVIVQQRLKDGGIDLQRRLASAYQGITDAWSLGITKIPAVVVDRRYVVYGERDVTRALARIDEYRRMRP